MKENPHKWSAEEVRDAYDLQRQKLGRPPRCGELRIALGMADSTVRRWCRKLGLQMTGMASSEKSRICREARNPEAVHRRIQHEKQIAQADPFIAANYAAFDLRQRIKEIEQGGDPAARPKVLTRPGDGYAPGQRITITCPVCGRRSWICPRMHPYWLRDKSGMIHYLCSDICTGEPTMRKVGESLGRIR